MISGKTMPWDETCDSPSADDELISGWCPKVKAARSFLIVSAVFSFFAASGNAAGIYTGNTLIDAAAGVVAAGSSFFSAIAISIMFMLPCEDMTGSVGFLMAAMCAGFQLTGGICGCIGTCQEMHDMAKLAASLQIGVYKEAVKTAPRSERCANLREKEQEEADEIYNNLSKRKKAAEAALASNKDADDEDVEAPPAKVPVMLKRVLFRKPEGDDDEIPTRMLEDAFAEIDGDGSGSIDLDELVGALRQCGLAVSDTACDTIMREIDKNASGDVDLREFIEFFRNIEELSRFGKKAAARQQFLSFLLNFCFLGDIVVVGVMLMMFIRMDEADSPDTYSIIKNLLMALSAFLGILFLMVILMPILRLALGPTASRMQAQYELAQEIKKSQKKPVNEEVEDTGPRMAGYGPDDPPPPVNAAMFGRSYRPGRVDSEAWTPALEDKPPPSRGSTDNAVVVRAASHAGSVATSGHGTEHSGSDGNRLGSHNSENRLGSNVTGGSNRRATNDSGAVQRVAHGKHWRYEPSNYSDAAAHSNMMETAGLGPIAWSPMQVRDVNLPKQTAPAILPGVPPALENSSFPSHAR
jgi:hypothetical protein